jgi:hypothetical protein
MIWTVLTFGRHFIYRTEARIVFFVTLVVIVGRPNRFYSTSFQVQHFLDDDSVNNMMIGVTVHPVASLVFGVDVVVIVIERNSGDGACVGVAADRELCIMTNRIGNIPVVIVTRVQLLLLIRRQVYEDTFLDAVVSLAVGVWLVGGLARQLFTGMLRKTNTLHNGEVSARIGGTTSGDFSVFSKSMRLLSQLR